MSNPDRVRTGLEVLLDDPGRVDLSGARLGLIAHPASVTAELSHAADQVHRHPKLDLVALFGPQHGARGDKQDNMVESGFFRDPATGLPVHSLYGEHRKPTPEMLAAVDAVLFDLQDVGVRIYTYIWTMSLAMEACKEQDKRFVVLDRPNPITGAEREGDLLRPGFESFVGRYPLPLRHGLTVGEVARYLNAARGIGCDLEVVPMTGWRRAMWFDQTGLPYVLPSPNLPTVDGCVVFPGMVLLEGTNLSEGRGTTRPFELLGAPYLEADRFVARLAQFELPGVRFRPSWFEPTFQKHAGQLCGGCQVHVTDRDAFRPVETGLAVLRAARDLAPDEFGWRPPPYEYEEVKPAIDILWGSDRLRAAIEGGAAPADILAESVDELHQFDARVAPHLLYE